MFRCDLGGHKLHACRWFAIAFSLLIAFSPYSAMTSVAVDERPDEAKELKTYQQFLKILVGNPRFGTAYDRVYEFNANRGSIHDFYDALVDLAGLAEANPVDELRTHELVSEFKVRPRQDVAALLAGMLDLQHVNTDAAVRVLTFAAEQRSDDAIANWYLGKALVMNRQLDAAPAAFEKAIACQPAKADLLEIYKELARTLQRSQQDAGALAAWQQLENLFPGDLRVKEQIATALAQDGRWQDALTRYQAMAKDSQNPDQRVQANLAASDLMIQLGRPQDAIVLLEKQLATLDADSWLYKEIRRRIEATFRGRDDLPGLVAYYENWIKDHPEDVDAMARLGRTLSLQNQTADAAVWYRKAIELAPTNVALRESLIEQLVRDNRLSDAITQYEQMAKFDVGNLDHIEAWGQLYLSNKDFSLEERQTKAATVWERLLTNRAEDSVTIARLASLLRRAELRDRAIALYRSAIEKSPNDPQFREYLGEYLHQLQRTDEAVAEWNEIAAGDRRSKENLIRLAEVLNRFGQIEAALAAMREACGLNPDPAERVKFVEMLREAVDVGRTKRSAVPAMVHNAGTAQPALNGDERLRRDDVKSVTDVPANAQQVARSGLQDFFTEAFEQLDLAEQSAETTDERQQILHERIKTLIAAGKLDNQINLLFAELNASTNVTAERWRTLALYQDAAEKLNDAVASAMRVVELEPQSIVGWAILADLYERTGRLGDAVDAMKKLAALDRRGISEYLKKTARFQVRLGEFDNALTTGRDVIKATPGNPEAYQFFADLAFEVGQPIAAVDALRQAVRVNPGDEASLRALARTLADEFQTPEAIDLYWRAFDKAQDLESQTNIVVALSNLYLRSDQFSKLIERLELRSRELNLPTEMTRCIAMAYREAGDFRKSRETLERLMVDESQNVALLKELQTLAEQEHSISQMELYQRQIVELTGADDERRRLIEILGQEGLYDEAAEERLRLAESRTDRVDILREIDILVSGEYDDVAEMLCQRLLESSPDDWEALNAYRGILQRRLQLVEARDVSRRIMQLNASFDALSSNSTPGSKAAPAHAIDTPESFSAWLIQSFENPAGSFGAIYCDCAASLVFRVGASTPQADLDMVFASHLSERDQLRLAAWLIRSVTARSPASNEVWIALEGFLQGPPTPARTAVQLFETCQRYSANDLPVEGQQRLKERSKQLLKTLIKDAPAWLDPTAIPMSSLVPDHDFDDEIATLVEEKLRTTHLIPELRALWSVAARFQNSKRIKSVIAASQNRLDAEPEFAGSLAALFSDGKSGFGSTDLIAVRLGRDADAVLALLDLIETVGIGTERPARQLPGKELMTLPEILSEQLGTNKEFTISGCLSLMVELDAEARVADWCRTKATSGSPAEHVRLNLIRAELARQLGDDIAEIASLIDAAEGDPGDDNLRFLIAQLAAKQGLIDEAVLLVDSLNLTDATRQIAREEFVLRLLFPAEKSERCVMAAERLFGLPLNMDQQRDLIPVLDKLGMRDKVAAMQSRFGRGTQDRQSILGRQLQTYVAAGKNELAGEVAWELLKLASGGSLFSGYRPDDDRDDGGERLQAIKALGRLNRLQPLIDRYEAMLSESSGSVELLEILAEFHDAAEQWDLLSAKRDRIALLTKKASPSLKAKAVELEKNGDVSGACDIYLTILKDDPAAFSDEMETYVQAFERAKRQADFLTAVMNLKSEYWSEHASLIINVIAKVAHQKTDDQLVQSSITKLLATQRTRRLTIGGFLARLDVANEDQLTKALLLEVADEARIAWSASFSEISLIIQHLKQPHNLQAVNDALIRQIDDGGVGAPGSQLLAAYVEARLGHSDALMRRLEKCLTGTAPRPELRHLIVLNQRLKELGSDWNDERLWLLERMSKLVGEDAELTDTVLEELGSTYEHLGRVTDARNVINQRVQRILAGTGTDHGDLAESIRQLLQAGEKIQHSGFPIEGARLLLNVTPHDINEFTSDLDDDKAVAFKSRFNASQRWARQQISADKLVSWFEIAVQSSREDPAFSDLLLELSGTTDPRTHDVTVLQSIRLNSAIVTAIEKQTFNDAKQQAALKEGIRALLSSEVPSASLLTAALAIAVQLNDAELATSVVEELNASKGSATESAPTKESAIAGIPQTLRSAPNVPQILAAKILLSSDHKTVAIRKLLTIASTDTGLIENRLVRIAILNECVVTAAQAKLTDLATALEAERDAVIDEQNSTVSIGTPASIDLRHEIRTRLLGLKEP